jgi:dihydrofolate reductase
VTRPVIALVVAVAKNGVIGRDGRLPWRIPEDMKWFKEKTLGKPCVMGRKTWESLPKRPLPGRTNIVVTRARDYAADCAVVAHSLDDAIAIAARENAHEISIIGGGELYAAALPLAGRIYLTRVDLAIEGDAHFPALDPVEWNERVIASHSASPERPIGYSFCILERKEAPDVRP